MKNEKIKEPSIIIKPVGGFGGLDSLHLLLIVVVALLFLLLLVVSMNKPIVITANNTTGNVSAIHTSAQIKTIAERVLASYANVNNSLSLLPYISNVSGMGVSYMPASKSWYVSVSAKNFVNNVAFQVGFLISDTNTSQVTPLLQAPKPSQLSNNTVVAQGVIQLVGKPQCISRSPTNVYWFVDPYAVGSVGSLLNASTIMQLYGSKVNLTLKMVVGTDTQKIGAATNLINALYLSKYTLCASQQQGFPAYAANLNSVYNGTYLSQNALNGVVSKSKLNSTQLAQCVNASSTTLNVHALLAQYYGITQTPATVVDCRYEALPQTVRGALCYTNSTLC